MGFQSMIPNSKRRIHNQDIPFYPSKSAQESFLMGKINNHIGCFLEHHVIIISKFKDVLNFWMSCFFITCLIGLGESFKTLSIPYS